MTGHDYLDTANKIFNWLSEHQHINSGYNCGGIYDPIDKRVMGEHYSTTFFALLGLLLIDKNYKVETLSKIKLAIDFHIKTSKDEYREGNWAYHWDFNNYSLISCYRLLKEKLSEEEKKTYISTILSWKENRHKAVNWVLMRAYNSYSRYMEFGKLFDRVKYSRHINYALKSQLKDGCIDDERMRSRPIQYHAYSAALLYKIYELNSNKKVLFAFVKALNYLIPFIDPIGEFNYLGRGQGQIFGYAAAIFVFEAGKSVIPERKEELDEISHRCWSYLKTYQLTDGSFPLVLNEKHGKREYGWYDYHHLTVYNAFLAVWLVEAANIREKEIRSQIEIKEDSFVENKMLYNKPSGSLIFKTKDYFICFTAGQKGEYLTDCGLAIQHLYVHKYGVLISCPGGPGGAKKPLFAEKHARYQELMRNFCTPLFLMGNSWIVPAGGDGCIEQVGEKWFRIKYDYLQHLAVSRHVKFENDSITISDKIMIHVLPSDVKEIRLANIPLITHDHSVTIKENEICINAHRIIKIYVETDAIGNMAFEMLHTAKGDVKNYYFLLKDVPEGKSETFNVTLRILLS